MSEIFFHKGGNHGACHGEVSRHQPSDWYSYSTFLEGLPKLMPTLWKATNIASKLLNTVCKNL